MTTTSARLRRAETIFFEIADLAPPERAAALSSRCGGDLELAREVESLFEHEVRMQDFLEEPALGTDFKLLPAAANADVERDEMIGLTIGRYRIERRIGSGGMGIVYLASRADLQFEQRVALKLVKRGMDTDEILKRFRRERQTLAALEHPNIARLIDGGATDRGEPYLVMELVLGEPIDVYCDRFQLSIEDRLALFLVVCEAVRHAHQKLIVHRDLKPGNILVARDGTPKLVDFGIAAVLDTESDRPVTEVRERRLTPEYASPEHVAGEPVATSTDVYSLGVILYELLTGRRPYLFTTRTPENIQRVVFDTEPASPSARVRELDPSNDVAGAAAARSTTPDRLARRLRGDLDNIVSMAMRKEPARRYPSVDRFADDLRRHLANEPVVARPDTFGYRADRFVRRHVLATASALSIATLIVVGGALFAWKARVADRERDQASLAREESDAMLEFLQHTLESADPARSGENVTVHEVMDEARARLDDTFATKPLVEASLRRTIGLTYLSIGLASDARTELEKTLALREKTLGAEHHDVAVSRAELASAIYAENRFDEAIALLERAVAAFERAPQGESAELASALSSLGAVTRSAGQFERAEELQRRALDMRRRLGAADGLDVAESSNNLALVLMQKQEYDEARALLEDALRIRTERLGEHHPLVAQSIDNLATLFHHTGALDRAEPLYRKALALEIDLLGPDHPDVAITHRNLALLLASTHRLPEAVSEMTKCVETRERLQQASDPRRVVSELDLGDLLASAGRFDEAREMFERALDATRELPADSQSRQVVLTRAAAFFERRGDAALAAELRAKSPQR